MGAYYPEVQGNPVQKLGSLFLLVERLLHNDSAMPPGQSTAWLQFRTISDHIAPPSSWSTIFYFQ